jgi:hypothetical protein
MGEREMTFEAEGVNAGTLTHPTSRRQAGIPIDSPPNLQKFANNLLYVSAKTPCKKALKKLSNLTLTNAPEYE